MRICCLRIVVQHGIKILFGFKSLTINNKNSSRIWRIFEKNSWYKCGIVRVKKNYDYLRFWIKEKNEEIDQDFINKVGFTIVKQFLLILRPILITENSVVYVCWWTRNITGCNPDQLKKSFTR